MPDPGYRILTNGDLEIATMGTWRIVAGCSCRGVFEYDDRMGELEELLKRGPEGSTVETLYRGYQCTVMEGVEAPWPDGRRFRYLCDRVLELNGLDPDQLGVRDLEWVIFGWTAEDGTPQQSPLALLNTPPEPRHPRAASADEGPNDFVRMLAAIMSLPDTSPAEALAVATSMPLREALGLLDERAWQAMPQEEREKLRFKKQADRLREKLQRGEVA